MSLVWVNGVLVDKAEARVSPFDHGFLYGDGVWEPLRVFGGKLFRPADHLGDLFRAAEVIDLLVPHTRDELIAAIEATVRANNRTDGYIRVIVSRGPGTVGPDPRKIDPQVYIIAEEYQPFPLDLYGHGLHAVTCPFRFTRSMNVIDYVRSLGRTHLVLAKQYALRNGCLEAVLVDDQGRVIGTTEGDLYWVRGRQYALALANPPAGEFIVVADILADTGFLTDREAPTSLDDLRAADEVFLAGTSCGVIGIVRLDGKDIGSGTEGPVTRAVREAYQKLTRGDGPPRGTLPDEGGAS